MRALLFILILAVVALLIAFATGYLNITQTRPASVPDVDAGRGGVSASGGQAPAFDVETGSVSVGTTQTNVTLPTVKVEPANGAQSNTATNPAR